VTVDVRVDGKEAEDYDSVKAVLHWDRVHLFGGNWPNPKNSPMHLQRRDKDTATYGLTLGSLPPGKYEFTAHVLGANDLWVRADAPTEVNGRVEVLPNRASSSRKREDIPTEPEAGAGDSVPKMAEREGVSGRASSRAHPS
jgi:hypothetical protein